MPATSTRTSSTSAHYDAAAPGAGASHHASRTCSSRRFLRSPSAWRRTCRAQPRGGRPRIHTLIDAPGTTSNAHGVRHGTDLPTGGAIVGARGSATPAGRAAAIFVVRARPTSSVRNPSARSSSLPYDVEKTTTVSFAGRNPRCRRRYCRRRFSATSASDQDQEIPDPGRAGARHDSTGRAEPGF